MGWISKTNNQELDQVKAEAEATYRKQAGIEDQAEAPIMPQPQRPLTYMRPKLRHTWKEGDTIQSIGLKYGIDPEEILDINLVEEHELQPGEVLQIPSKHVVKRSKKIRYEALDRPVEMHVNKLGGIKKYAFGNVKSANDISGSGHFPHTTPITIVGIAHVPVGEDILAYYMDRHAFGNYATTGKVSWNIGYAWSELTEGKYEPPAPITVPEPDAPTILDEPDEPATMFDEPEASEPEAAPPEDTDVIEEKPDGVLRPLNADYSPKKFLYEDDIEVHELHERHDPITRHANDPVWIIGTFRHEGVEYYQPGRNVGEVVASGLLWPIPMDAVLPEEEMFDYSQKRRPLTKQEQWFELLMRASANYTKLVLYIKQKYNKE